MVRGGITRVAKESASLDRCRDGFGYHAFPGRRVVLDALQDVAGKNIQNGGIESHDAVDEVVLQKVCVEVPQAVRHLEILCRDEDPG